MISRLIARGFSAAIQLLTGARALWQGCRPSADRRVYFGNHASHGDFVMIWSALPAALRRNVRPVAGADYWNRDPLRRYVINAVFNGVLIERDPAKRTRDAVETLCDAVDGGASLIVFPEGTRNRDEGLLPFKSGIYHLARLRPELEFVPVWLDNLKRVMPKGTLLPLPLLCTATFGEPLRLRAGEDKQAFLDRARDALQALDATRAAAPAAASVPASASAAVSASAPAATAAEAARATPHDASPDAPRDAPRDATCAHADAADHRGGTAQEDAR